MDGSSSTRRLFKMAAQQSVRRKPSHVKRFGERALGSLTFHLSRFLRAMRERRMGKGASPGKVAVLALSGRASEKTGFFNSLPVSPAVRSMAGGKSVSDFQEP
jgi:hypothetical protein